jgi:WASH complex subunit strumpellin
VSTVKENFQKYWGRTDTLMSDLSHLLVEGVVIPEYVLENTYKLLNVVREANVTIRWLMLHSHTIYRKLRYTSS